MYNNNEMKKKQSTRLISFCLESPFLPEKRSNRQKVFLLNEIRLGGEKEMNPLNKIDICSS